LSTPAPGILSMMLIQLSDSEGGRIRDVGLCINRDNNKKLDSRVGFYKDCDKQV